MLWFMHLTCRRLPLNWHLLTSIPTIDSNGFVKENTFIKHVVPPPWILTYIDSLHQLDISVVPYCGNHIFDVVQEFIIIHLVALFRSQLSPDVCAFDHTSAGLADLMPSISSTSCHSFYSLIFSWICGNPPDWPQTLHSCFLTLCWKGKQCKD